MNPAVVITDLSFTYPAYGRPPAALFSELSLTVTQGKIHVLCGEPGSGKSTLAHIAAGLIPQYSGGVISGDIRIFGTPAADIAYHELVPLLSLVMQDSDSQIVTTSCEEEAAFPLESLGMDRREMKSRVEAALEFFGMSAFRHREPAELSGGEKKKLMLAVSYAVDAPLLVLDESLEEIDPEFRRKYVQYLKTSGKTVIYFASKIDDILSEAADYWFELRAGAVRESDRESISRTFRFSSSPFEPFPEPAESLRIKNLTFSYSGGFSINVADLNLRAGEITALVGRNGSGKTTLCRILSGLIKPDGGRIEILGGEGWEAADPDILSAWSGYMFQNPDYQIFLPTIDEEIAYGLKRARIPGEERKKLTDRARVTFELPEGTIPPSVLSYGERKQLQAAVYSVLPKGIYIFDEIDSALSFPMIRRMLSAFYRSDAVIVVITHQMEFARGIARRVITMDQGRITDDRQIPGEGL